jgi:predicted component of type VI protein secretion system
MDENKTISVSRVYAPNEYSVWLSPRDRARYEGVEQEVIDELCAYLLEHARGEDLALASRPQIVFHTDENLQLGEFGIEARLARLEEEPLENEEPSQPAPAARRTSAAGAGASVGPAAVSARSPAAAPAPAYAESEEVGNTMIFSNSQRTREAVEQTGARRRPKALLLVAGRRLLVAPRGATIGRSRDCDIVLEDSSISRRHAELRPGGQGWVIEDLGSTNGVRVNGNTVHSSQEVRTGDRIEIGSTEMLFEIAP